MRKKSNPPFQTHDPIRESSRKIRTQQIRTLKIKLSRLKKMQALNPFEENFLNGIILSLLNHKFLTRKQILFRDKILSRLNPVIDD